MSPQAAWQTKVMKDLATINYGKSPSQILDEYGIYTVFGTGGVERLGNDYLYEGESIILGRKGTIDRVFFATGRFWTIDTAYYLSKFDGALPRWLFYFLQTQDLRQLNEATGVPSLARETLYKIKVTTPPPTEQTKIAEILSTVDRAIEQTEALIAKQERIKTGLMQELLTRGIDEHGNLRSESTHQFKDSPLGRIPLEWETKRLDWLASEIVDCPHTTPEFTPGGVLVARTVNVKSGRFVPEHYYVSEGEYSDRISRLEPRCGDIIFTREAPVGEAFIVPQNLRVCLGQRTMLIRCNHDKCLPEYLLEVVYGEGMRIRFDQMVGGTTNPHLNVEDVRALILKVPPVKEQRRISTSLRGVREAIEHASHQKAKLSLVKTALMQDLLTGRRRVTPLLELEHAH